MILTRRQVCAMTAVAALGQGLADCSGHPGHPGHRVASRPMPPRADGDKPAWLLTRYALGQVVQDPVVRAKLGGSPTFQLVRPGQRPLAWDGSVTVVTFPAVGELTRTVMGEQLPAGTSAVLYDCEAWPFTPTAEQHDPVGAAASAKAVAHGHGLALMVAPALNLATVRHDGASGPRWQRFLESGLIAELARTADVVGLQAQSLERDAQAYQEFVREAVSQATSANPRVRTLAGLSANPPGAPVTSEQLITAVSLTRTMVSGYWLNIPGRGPRCPACHPPRPDIARAVLRAVLEDGTGPSALWPARRLMAGSSRRRPGAGRPRRA